MNIKSSLKVIPGSKVSDTSFLTGKNEGHRSVRIARLMVKNEISEGFSSSYLFLKCSVAIVNMLLPKQINLFQLSKSRR